jgi:hypothetical protein
MDIDPTAPPAAPRAPVRWRDLRRSQKLIVLGLGMLLLLAGLEAISRVYWWQSKGVRVVTNEAIFRSTFHEIATSGIDEVAPYHGDDSYDVLLLGASVLHPRCGDIAPRLRDLLVQKVGRPVRIINYSYIGRTSVESRMKYARLEDRRFDLVLLYHSINDAHLNNCPPGEFRADYTHVRHIAMIKPLDDHKEVEWFCFPFTARYMAINLGDRWGLTRGQWDHKYGGDLRTPPSYEANVEAVAEIAKRRGDRLMLATYACYIPANYTAEDYQAGRLDYASVKYPPETWGDPTYVTRAVDAHNDAVRRVAARQGTLFVDIASKIPHGRINFDDPCHLTAHGCQRFAELVVEGLNSSP